MHHLKRREGVLPRLFRGTETEHTISRLQGAANSELGQLRFREKTSP